MDEPPSFHVIIIGGGITGLALATGLERRGIHYTVYERAAGFREVGAGIGISRNAEEAMKLIDPQMKLNYKQIATPNGEDYFQWVDGFKTDEVMYRLYLGEGEFEGCRRSEFLESIAKLVPASRVQFCKELDTIEEGDKQVLTFKDGHVATADVVIGCDGIHSRVRELVLGENHPAARPQFTGRVCYRTLIPMATARATLGHQRTFTRYMYLGPGGHAITYPVSDGAVLNALIVVNDDSDHWQDSIGRVAAPESRESLVARFRDWHPTMRAIVDLFPEHIDTWTIFDMLENPAPGYVKGSLALAGDAAHAAGPHLGAGAAMGIEDALLLSCLFEEVGTMQKSPGRDSRRTPALLQHALQVYSNARYERTQWLVKNTRDAVEIFHMDAFNALEDCERLESELESRFLKIWNYDNEAASAEALSELKRRMEQVYL